MFIISGFLNTSTTNRASWGLVRLTLVYMLLFMCTQGVFASDLRGIYLTAGLSLSMAKDGTLLDGSCSHPAAYFGCGFSVATAHGINELNPNIESGGYWGIGFRVNEDVRVEAVVMQSMRFPVKGFGWIQSMFSFEDPSTPYLFPPLPRLTRLSGLSTSITN